MVGVAAEEPEDPDESADPLESEGPDEPEDPDELSDPPAPLPPEGSLVAWAGEAVRGVVVPDALAADAFRPGSAPARTRPTRKARTTRKTARVVRTSPSHEGARATCRCELAMAPVSGSELWRR